MSTVLEQQLVELAQRLDVGLEARLVDEVLARLDDDSVPALRLASRRRPLAIAGMLAAAALAIVFILPSPRRTVAHWFGIGIVRIDGPVVTLPTATSAPPTSPTSPTSPTLTSPPATSTPVTFPPTLDLGDPTSAADASSRTGLPTALATKLGTPDGIYVVTPPDSGQIVVVYPPNEMVPASRVAGVGALLSTLPGEIDEGLFNKVKSAGTIVETLTFATAAGVTVDAIWLSGEPHEYFFIDENDGPAFETLRLATNTLLWVDGGVTHRLEADVSRDIAVDIARAVVQG